MRTIHWDELFEKGFGNFLEEMRTAWKKKYDYVLIDSRTGITDIGGICTILLPDYLISMFTTNEQSLLGVKDTMARARARQSDLPLDRQRMAIIPIAARDESGTEYQRAAQWRKRFAQELASFYSDWIHKEETAESVLDYLKIPYIAYWSFGEQLPALREDPQNPKTLAYSYALIARLIDSRLDWSEVREGRKTSELQQKLEAERQLKRAEADKVRAEIVAKQQTDAAEALARRQLEVEARAKQISSNLLTSMRSSFGLVVTLLVLGVIGALAINDGVSQSWIKWPLYVFVPVSLLAALGGLLAINREWQRKKELETEVARFKIVSGEYASMSAEEMILRFSERIAAIAAEEKREKQESKAPDDQEKGASRSSAGSQPESQSVTLPTSSLDANASPQAPANNETPANVSFDVFLSFADGGITGDWVRQFSPLFNVWLTQCLGRNVNIYIDSQAALGGNWPDATTRAIAQSRVALLILTKRYLTSESTRGELEQMQDKLTEGRIFCLTLDAGLSSALPSMLQSIVPIDFSDVAFIGEAFSKSDRYVEFQGRVRDLAMIMAKKIDESPILTPA